MMSNQDFNEGLKKLFEADLKEANQEDNPAPVAVYMGVYGGRHIVGFTESKLYPVGTALYLHPPKPKTTVYLTKNEIDLLCHWRYEDNLVNFARAIEQEVLRRNK